MKALQEMTATELWKSFRTATKELKEAEYDHKNRLVYSADGNETTSPGTSEGYIIHVRSKIAALTAELDARCEMAGIQLSEDEIPVFVYQDFKYDGVGTADAQAVYLGIPATEQHALEGYLLQKGDRK